MAKTLDYDFTDPQFDGTTGIDAQTGPTLTVARAAASTATVMDYNNVLKTVNADEPRFTGGRRVENLFSYSQDLSTSWSNSGTIDYQASGTAPDGTNTANLVEGTGGGVGKIYMSRSFGLSLAGQHTFSIYAKADNLDWVRIAIQDFAPGTGYCFFDVANGVKGTSALVDDAGIEPASVTYPSAPAGWYRIWVTQTITAADLGGSVRFGPADADLDWDVTKDDTSSSLFWGIQLENVSGQDDTTPSEYIATTTAAKAQWYDTQQDGSALTTPITGLLIEDARTNLCTYSEDIGDAAWTKTGATVDDAAAVAPDGKTTMQRLNSDTGDSYHRCYATPITGATSGADYTNSAYVKADGANFVGINLWGANHHFVTMVANLSTGAVTFTDTGSSGGNYVDSGCEDVGGGIYRIWITGNVNYTTIYNTVWISDSATPSGPSYNTQTGQTNWIGVEGEDVLIWGAQTEAGSFPTSYISAVASSVTRNADVVTTTDMSWETAGVGTYYVEGVPGQVSQPTTALCPHKNVSDRILFGSSATPTELRFLGKQGSSWNLTKASVYSIGTTYKFSGGYALNDVAAYVDGALVGTDASSTETVGHTTLYVGKSNSGSHIGGHIQRIVYWDERLEDSVLEDLSNGTFPSAQFPGSVAGDGGHIWPPRASDPRWTQIISDSGITASGNFIDDVHAALEALGSTTGQLDDLWKKVKTANSVTDTSEPYLY